MKFSILLSFLLVVPCLAGTDHQLSPRQLAKRIIAEREENFVRISSHSLYGSMHPPLEKDQPQPPMRPRAHHPLAHKLRQKIYSTFEPVAAKQPGLAMLLNLELLQLLLDNGAEKEWQTEDGPRTLTTWAVEYGANKCLEVLLKAGCSPNAMIHDLQRQGESLLQVTILKSNVDMVAMLLKFGANLMYVNGRHALEHAMDHRRYAMIPMLLEAELNPLSPPALDALRLALIDGNETGVTAMLEGGIDPNGSSQGLPMLCHALLMGSFDMADLLYDYKADVNHKVDGVKLIHMPGISEDVEVKRWLLEHGAAV